MLREAHSKREAQREMRRRGWRQHVILDTQFFQQSARVVVQAFESFGELEAGVLQIFASRRLDPFADTLDDVTFLARFHSPLRTSVSRSAIFRTRLFLREALGIDLLTACRWLIFC
jgi:hypothetical protein